MATGKPASQPAVTSQQTVSPATQSAAPPVEKKVAPPTAQKVIFSWRTIFLFMFNLSATWHMVLKAHYFKT